MFRWTARLKGSPATQHRFPAVSVGHEVNSFEGSHKNHSDQMCVHVLNTVSLRWRDLPPVTTTTRKGSSCEAPPRLWGHTAVLIEDTIYIWGGKCGEVNVCRKDLYTFDVDTHKWLSPEVSGSVPEGRKEHSACVSGKVMYYICGGFDKEMRHKYDLYKLDTITMVWSLINAGGITPPPDNLWNSATIIGTKMFVFEGETLISEYLLLRVFDTETGWLSSSEPEELPKGYYHSAFSYNGELYVFCRKVRLEEKFEYFSDLFKLDPQTFSWKKVEPRGESPSWWSEPCCCLLGDRVVVFGGYSHQKAFSDDLYILDVSPSLKTLCKLAVIRDGLERSELPHNIRWELAVITGTQQDHEKNTTEVQI